MSSQTLLKSTTLFISLCISLLIAECGMRIYHVAHKKHRYIILPDLYLGHAHAKNNTFDWWGDANHPEFYTHHETNNCGFMSEHPTITPKPKDTYRILILGDSLTEAFQVERKDNFCSLIENNLKNSFKNKGLKLEILNAGIQGSSPIYQYLNYKRNLHKLNADLVLIQLFANDIAEDYSGTARGIMSDSGLPLRLHRHFVSDQKKKTFFYNEKIDQTLFFMPHTLLVEYSRLYEYIYFRIIKSHRKHPFNTKMRSAPPHDDVSLFFAITDQPFDNKKLRDQAYQLTESYLLALNNLVQSHDAQFASFIIPIEAQLTLENYSISSQRYFAKQANTYFNDQLKKTAQKNNYFHLDLLTTFENHRAKPIYFQRDGHLSELGHKITASSLAEFLQLHFLD